MTAPGNGQLPTCDADRDGSGIRPHTPWHEAAMQTRPLPFLIILLLSVLLLPGCSNLNCTRLESLLGGHVNLVRLGADIGDRLIDEAVPPLVPRQVNRPVLVTTLVENTKLGKSSDFGRTLQNHIASRFVRRGYTVREIKLRSDLLILQGEGEFMLSRDLEQLADRQRAQAVVVGTYSLADRVMYLNVRLVRPGDRTILATWDKRLCLDERTLRMLGLQFQEDTDIKPPAESVLDRILY